MTWGTSSQPREPREGRRGPDGKGGGKLVALYFTFGEYDFLSVAPNEEVMASALIAGAASGGISHLRTSVAMTSKDAMKAFKSAGSLSKSFKPPGR